jgi:hypothetical protein
VIEKLNKEKRQLLSSWTLELANWLITEHSLSRSEAFRKAHLTRQLLGMLGEGVVTFCYKKTNGEERQARGTLCHGISDDFDHYEYKAEDGDTFANVLKRGVYVYFDLDCRSFRSFAAKNLISLTPNPSPTGEGSK